MFEPFNSRAGVLGRGRMKWDKTRICKVVCSFRRVAGRGNTLRKDKLTFQGKTKAW